MATRFNSGAVVGQPDADSAGVSVLKKGGNAVDAAVTAAFLSCVVAPKETGFGGYGGVMLISMAGKVHAIDFNTVAPAAASPRMFSVAGSDGRWGSTVRGRANTVGYKAISVPGVLAGLSMALEKFGTLSLADALAPAIKACKNGFRVSASYAEAIAAQEKTIREFPVTAKLLLEGDVLPTTKDKVKNPDLGKMLEQVAEKGVREFYEGRIADRIVKHVEENDGLLTKEDMASYQPRELDPIQVKVGGADLYFTPLCSSGVSLAQMCRLAELAHLNRWERDAARLAHGWTDIIRAAWLDRYRYFGDPDVVKVPIAMLLSEIQLGAAGRDVEANLDEGRQGQCLIRPLYSGGGTAHISTVDENRNMVSLSFTHGPSFGSFVTVPRMGLILNAGMSRFDPGSGLPNSVAPGKRPIINMAPVLALRDGVPFLTMGASGGTRIPSSLFQVLARRLVLEEDIEWSVSAGRLHSEGNDWVRIEEEFGELAPQYLKEVGYTLSKKGTAAAVVRAIEVDEDGKLTAVMDPRMGNVKEKGY